MAVFGDLKKVVEKLRTLAAKHKGGNPIVAVSYTTSYGYWVHENLEAHHNAGQQAKFLEQPAREEGPRISEVVVDGLRAGKTMAQSLLLGGLLLQRLSMKLVPVDTGTLKGSAMTTLEKGNG